MFCRACNATRGASQAVPARSLATVARPHARGPSVRSSLPPKRATPLPKLGRRVAEVNSLPLLLRDLAAFKAQSRKPKASAYIAIIQAAGDFALSRSNEGDESENLGWQVAIAAWNDAELGGMNLGKEGLDALLRMVLLLNDMFAHGITPSISTVRQAIRLACEWGFPRLALQLAQKAETESMSGARIEKAAWLEILTSSADSHYLQGVETAWARVSKSHRPDEGLSLAMLNTAGRWGRPDFASSVLALLPQPQEQHLAPLLEAFCNAGQVPEALHVLTALRDAGIEPTMATVQPIANALKDVEVIDQAFYALEDMKKAGQPVDITALNALIDASGRLGDLQRVRATQTAAADLGVVPNIDTFNLVLAGCVKSQHRPLGDTILSEMMAENVSPNAVTYEQLILLCLSQPAYDDAFYYLEKSKADGFKPPYSVYESMIRKCVVMKDTRWRLLADELRAVGYRVESDLHEFINSGGQARSTAGKRRTQDRMVGDKRREWAQQKPRGGP
ncbi:hypothetical protein IAU60_003583 [Kwoniella sp. DSM 27419]